MSFATFDLILRTPFFGLRANDLFAGVWQGGKGLS
jgi:hypothetical protein